MLKLVISHFLFLISVSSHLSVNVPSCLDGHMCQPERQQTRDTKNDHQKLPGSPQVNLKTELTSFFYCFKILIECCSPKRLEERSCKVSRSKACFRHSAAGEPNSFFLWHQRTDASKSTSLLPRKVKTRERRCREISRRTAIRKALGSWLVDKVSLLERSGSLSFQERPVTVMPEEESALICF